MFKRLRIFPVLIVVIFLMGCVSSKVNNKMNITPDGKHIPEHINYLFNDESGISITASLVRQFFYSEGEETIVVPECVPFEKVYQIDKSKTKALTIVIHVHNPKRVKYSMWENHQFWYSNSKWPTQISKCFYQGKMSVKSYRVNLPLEDFTKAISNIELELKGSDDEDIVISLGDALYKLKGGGI